MADLVAAPSVTHYAVSIASVNNETSEAGAVRRRWQEKARRPASGTTRGRISDLDEMHMPWRQRLAFYLLPVPAVLASLVCLCRIAVQMSILRDMHSTKAAKTEHILLAAALVYQVFGAIVGPCLLIYPLSRRWRPRLRLSGPAAPAVDIVITCCSEDLEVIMDTVRAALDIDYPRHSFRVLVSDDGSTSALRQAISQLAKEAHPVFYTARPVLRPRDYKAGNLNHAIKMLESLPGRRADYIAGLDADMIPEKHWLSAILPHMMRDPKIGIVCPPQHFYNFPENDPLTQSQLHSYRWLDITNDMADAAWCTGSGWVMTRAAIDSIGGFPSASLTEDVYASILILSKGFKTVYLPEVLQWGLLPDTYAGHVKQFTRWTVGGAQMAVALRCCASKSRTGLLTIKQRILNGTHQLGRFEPIGEAIGLLVSPLLLCIGFQAMPYHDMSQLALLLRLQALEVLFGWLFMLSRSPVMGYQCSLGGACSKRWMSPYYAIALVRSIFLPSRLGGKVTGFTPTGTTRLVTDERGKKTRAPLSVRLRTVLLDCGSFLHLLVVALNIGAVCYRTRSVSRTYTPLTNDWWAQLLVSVLRPGQGLFETVIACLVPLQYAIFPPTVPDREDLLQRDARTGVAHPTEKSRKYRWTSFHLGFPQLYAVVVLHAVVVFAYSYQL